MASLADLPTEVIVKIFQKLSVEDVHSSCKRVNFRFQDIVKEHFETIDAVVLNLTSQYDGHVDVTIVNDILQQCRTSLKSVTLKNEFYTRDNLRISLSLLSNLEDLDLKESYPSNDKFLEPILLNCSKLQTIGLNKVTCQGLELILKYAPANLKVLDMLDSYGPHPEIAVTWSLLDRFKHLTHLSVTENTTPDFWQSVSRLKSLTHLDFQTFSTKKIVKTFNEWFENRSETSGTTSSITSLSLGFRRTLTTSSKDEDHANFWRFFANVERLKFWQRRKMRKEVNVWNVLEDYYELPMMFKKLTHLDMFYVVTAEQNLEHENNPAPPAIFGDQLESLRVTLCQFPEDVPDLTQKLSTCPDFAKLKWFPSEKIGVGTLCSFEPETEVTTTTTTSGKLDRYLTEMHSREDRQPAKCPAHS